MYLGELLSLSCALTWSIGTIFFKKSIQKQNPIRLTVYEIIIALLILIPVCSLIYRNFPTIELNQVFYLCLSGIFGIGLGGYFYFKTLRLVGASAVAIIECLYLPFTIALAAIFLSESMQLIQWFGMGLVLVAILLLKNNQKSPIPKHIMLKGILVGALSQLFMASGAIIMKPVLHDLSVGIVMCIRFSAALVFMLLLMKSQKQKIFIPSSLSNKSKIYFMIGTVFCTCITPFLWINGLKLTTVTNNSIAMQTSTFFTIILASLFLKESMGKKEALASLLAFSGALIAIF